MSEGLTEVWNKMFRTIKFSSELNYLGYFNKDFLNSVTKSLTNFCKGTSIERNSGLKFEYIHIYIYRQRESERESERERD